MALKWPQDVCVAGIGTSAAFAFDLGKSPLAVQTEAFAAALEDAGLSRDDVDGVVTAHGSPFGVDYDEFAVTAGLHCRWATQLWSHGRWATNMVAEAAMAIRSGLASVVAVVNTSTTGRAYAAPCARARRRGSPSPPATSAAATANGKFTAWRTPCGAATALVAQRYMDKYGATPDDLAGKSRSRSGAAQRSTTGRSCAASPWTGSPTSASRTWSARSAAPTTAFSNEGATCLLLTGRQRAASLRQPGVVVAGVAGLQASRDDSILFSPGGPRRRHRRRLPVRRRAVRGDLRGIRCRPSVRRRPVRVRLLQQQRMDGPGALRFLRRRRGPEVPRRARSRHWLTDASELQRRPAVRSAPARARAPRGDDAPAARNRRTTADSRRGGTPVGHPRSVTR